jgi:hypothetical protein
LTVAQILRTYGKQFTQVQTQYSDGHNGRCALGVIMSYFGWDGTDDYDVAKVLVTTMNKLKHVNIDEKLLIDINDYGYTFDQIADHLDRASGVSR